LKNRYVLYNQSVIPRESLNLSPEEWFTISTRCIRQSLFASGNRIPFLKPWLEILGKRFGSVGWHLPDEFKMPDFRLQLEKLLNRNRLFKGSWIHLLIIPVFPSTELDCSPGFRCIGLTEEIEFDYFPLNQKGLSIGVSEKHHNTADPFISSMVRSPLRDLLISQEAVCNGWDEIILTDQHGFLSETSGSNLFLKFRDRIVTPSPANHCFPRILTGIVNELIPQTGLTLEVSDKIRQNDLSAADEIFLTDDLNGIRWVLGYEKKRFYRKISLILHEELTALVRTTDQFQAGSSG
jgi:branched-subunit amino acid aminotransferase/4-amino-4-deoxychorismate lyase